MTTSLSVLKHNYKFLKADPETTHNIICQYMHYNGAFYYKTKSNYINLYLGFDGFGKITIEEANEQCFDWSHVRDSNHLTKVRMAVKILATY